VRCTALAAKSVTKNPTTTPLQQEIDHVDQLSEPQQLLQLRTPIYALCVYFYSPFRTENRAMTGFPWLKLWNETPDDPKFAAAAKMAGTSRSVAVTAFFKALTHANQSEARGSIKGLHPAVVAEVCEAPVDVIQRLWEAFRELGILVGEQIADWAERQGEKIEKPRSANAERVARHRAKKAAAGAPVARAPAPVTPGITGITGGITEALHRADTLEGELESEKEEEKNLVVTSADERESPPSEEFEEFWKQYPRKDSKDNARRAYAKARKKVSWATIMSGVLRYAAERDGQDRKFTKCPTTWLNGGCWEDDAGSPVPAVERRPSQKRGDIFTAMQMVGKYSSDELIDRCLHPEHYDDTGPIVIDNEIGVR
jgi:hypothetical protein